MTGALLLLSLLPELGPLVPAAPAVPAVPAAPPAAQSSGTPGAALPGIPCVGIVLLSFPSLPWNMRGVWSTSEHSTDDKDLQQDKGSLCYFFSVETPTKPKEISVASFLP